MGILQQYRKIEKTSPALAVHVRELMQAYQSADFPADFQEQILALVSDIDGLITQVQGQEKPRLAPIPEENEHGLQIK